MVGGLTRSVVPDALVVRPLLVPALATLADTSAFRRLFARAVRDRHRALINGETDVHVRASPGGGRVDRVAGRVAPRVARLVPADLRVPIVRLDPHDSELAASGLLVDIAGWRWPLTLVALLAAAGAALLAGGIRAALVYLGAAATGGGLIVAAAMAGLGEFVVSHAAHAADLGDDAERGALRAVWTRSSPTWSPRHWSWRWAERWWRPGLDRAPHRRRRRGVEMDTRAVLSPSRPASLVRAAVLIAAGAVLIFDPALLAKIVLVAAGVVVVLAGVSQLPAPGPRAGAARAPAARRPAGPGRRDGRRDGGHGARRRAGAAHAGRRDGESAGSAEGCNGSRALCGRRLDQVVFPGTHNSYAAADEPGWLFANQRHGIERQLNDGIRALTLDIHFGCAIDRADGCSPTWPLRARHATRLRSS